LKPFRRPFQAFSLIKTAKGNDTEHLACWLLLNLVNQFENQEIKDGFVLTKHLRFIQSKDVQFTARMIKNMSIFFAGLVIDERGLRK